MVDALVMGAQRGGLGGGMNEESTATLFPLAPDSRTLSSRRNLATAPSTEVNGPDIGAQRVKST